MKTNPVQKMVKKWKLWTIVVAVILVVGITMAAIFGFNTTVDFKSAKTVTIEYSYGTKANDLQAVCDASFAESGVSPIQSKVTTSAPGELIYYFDVNADLTAATAALEGDIQAEMVEDGRLENASFINVRSNVEEFQSGIAEGYVLRAAIAVGVFAILAFAYVSLRYKLSMGITMAATMLATGGLTVALVAHTRIPVTASFAYVAAFAVFVASVLAMMIFNPFRDALKEKKKEDESKSAQENAEERVTSAVDTKKLVFVTAALAVGVALVGAFVSTARWFALSAFVGLLAAFFAAWAFAPALLAVLDAHIKKSEKPLFAAKKKKEGKTVETALPQEATEEVEE